MLNLTKGAAEGCAGNVIKVRETTCWGKWYVRGSGGGGGRIESFKASKRPELEVQLLCAIGGEREAVKCGVQ